MKRILAVWMAAASGCLAAVSNPATFSNPAPIVIDTNASVTPYPSSITVSNLSGVVSKVSVQLNDFNHSFPYQASLLLVAPGSTRSVIMSHCGGSTAVSNVTLTLDDAAASPLSESDTLVSGVYQPARYSPAPTFPAPAPSPGSSNSLATFNGINPNGVWSLYLADGETGDTGAIDGGWNLTITTAISFTNGPPAAIVINDSSHPPTKATPYPSTITVSNLSGLVDKVTVRLLGVAHEFPDDIDILLVGPNGQNVSLWGEVGGENTITNVNVTFDDAAAQSILDDSPVTSGTYLPSVADTNLLVWPLLPGGIVVAQTLMPQLAVFNGTDPNGPWTLYVADNSPGGAGQIKNGWVLSIAAVPPTPLGLQVDGTSAILSWPATSSGLTLQSNPDLATTNWSAVATTPVYSGGFNVVTDVLSAGSVFYRLSH